MSTRLMGPLFALTLALVSPLSAQDSAPARGVVTGRVLHAESKLPISDVEVRLLPKPDGSWTFPLKPTRVRSNADGVFRFEDLKPGQYRVYAFHGTLASRAKQVQFDPVTIDAAGNSKPIDLMMREALKLKVRVLSAETGKPIANAPLRLRWTDQDDNAQTDANGEVLITGLTAGEQHVEAMADGYALVDRQQQLTANTTEIEFRLPKGGVLEGVITDDAGKPLKGVDISASPERRSMSRFDNVETDDQGRFKLRYLPLDAQFRLSASKKDYQHFYETASVNGDRKTIQLTPRPNGGDIIGFVVDQNGRPVANAEITNYSSSSAEYHSVRTNPEGRFEIRKLYVRHRDQAELVIRAEGFAPLAASVPQEAKTEPLEMMFTLEPGHRLQGRVVNAEGKPIAGAWVFYADGNRGFGGIGGKLVSDKDGRFSSNSLPAEAPLHISARGYSARENVRVPLNTDKEVSITLEPSAGLRGQIINAKTGKPVESFNVKLGFATDVPAGAQKPNGLTSSWMETGRDVRHAEGRFEWSDLPVRTAYDVIITAENYEPRRLIGQVASADAQHPRFELSPVDPQQQVEIAGTVVDAGGKPLRGVVMHLLGVDPKAFPPDYQWDEIPTHLVTIGQANLQPMCRFDHHTVTDAEGRYRFPPVSTKWDLQIVLWGEGVPTSRARELQKESRKALGELILTAPKGVTITGTIDPTVFPDVSEVSVATEEESFNNRRVSFARGKPAKEFVLRGLPDGKLTIVLMGPPMPVKVGDGEGFSTKVVGRIEVNARPGDELQVHFDGQFRTK